MATICAKTEEFLTVSLLLEILKDAKITLDTHEISFVVREVVHPVPVPASVPVPSLPH